MLPTGQTQHRFTQGFCSRSQTQEENQRWNTDSETGEKTDEGNTANWQTTMVESPKPRWRKNGNHSGGRDINFNGGKWETAGSKGMVVGEGKKRGSITPQLDPKWHSIEKDHPYKTRKGQKPKKKEFNCLRFCRKRPVTYILVNKNDQARLPKSLNTLHSPHLTPLPLTSSHLNSSHTTFSHSSFHTSHLTQPTSLNSPHSTHLTPLPLNSSNLNSSHRTHHPTQHTFSTHLSPLPLNSSHLNAPHSTHLTQLNSPNSPQKLNSLNSNRTPHKLVVDEDATTVKFSKIETSLPIWSFLQLQMAHELCEKAMSLKMKSETENPRVADHESETQNPRFELWPPNR